jgi:hypothetical protein
MPHRLKLVAVLLALGACQQSTEPPSLPSEVTLTGVVRDSTGLPIVGALVIYSAPVSAQSGASLSATSSLPLQADDDGTYLGTLTLPSPDTDSIVVRVWSTGCAGGWGAPYAFYIGDRTARDTLFQFDITLPQSAPRPSASEVRLCASDRHPDFFFNYTTYLELDSTQYVQADSGDFFGGTWQHHTSGSTNGDTGTFTGFVSPTAVVVVLTYDIVHAPCGATERLVGSVMPNGQWGALSNVSDPHCPVATLRLAFAPG